MALSLGDILRKNHPEYGSEGQKMTRYFDDILITGDDVADSKMFSGGDRARRSADFWLELMLCRKYRIGMNPFEDEALANET
jgi:hypothetical protein